MPSVPIHYSIVIPLFNESENIPLLIYELKEVMSNLDTPYEVILVDDGSRDETAALLAEELKAWPSARVFQFAKNNGQASALYFGIKQAVGSILIILDGDGQNDPRDIPSLLAFMIALKADMAIGVRSKRRDPILRRYMSRTANAIRSRLLGDGVTDSGCGTKVLKREVAEAFIPLRTLYSFMPALAVSAGFRVVQHTVNHRPRLKGISNYGFRVMSWRPFVDMIGVWWFIRRRCNTNCLISPKAIE